MTIKEELAELEEITRMLRSELFKKYIISPIKDKREAVKRAYFVKDVKSSWRAGGEYTTYGKILDLFEDIENDYKNKKLEADEEY